jgi:nucleotide-binding universal stress UspA family protein
MTKLDVFESVFRSADKPVYEYGLVEITRVLIVTDLTDAAAAPLVDQVRTFLSVLGENLEWHHLGSPNFGSVGSLLEQVEGAAPHLIVTYRHLHSNAWQWPHGLGEYLDVLTQATDIPVLVLPHPDADRALPHTVADTDCVMAITDHLTADARLVDYALRFTAPSGTCWLTHIESQRQFDRYLTVVEKIPEIETDDVRELVEAQLLKEPRDYIESCRKKIEVQGVPVKIEAIVAMGDRVEEYRRLVEDHRVDLLVLNTLDGDQLAMHGQAYPLAVRLRDIPLLML